ncbi:MAG: hypothetical protein Q7T82_13770 [Armatimonadota bacterium]|nr:hypothetical protein [Armatimonadota bacterium]
MSNNIAARSWLLAVLIIVLAAPSHAAPNLDFGSGTFHLDGQGYVTRWLVAGPDYKPYDVGRTEPGDTPEQKIEGWPVELPDSVALNAPGPFGKPWRYLSTRDDPFMEFGDWVAKPSAARMYAAVDLEASSDIEVKAKVWIGSWANIWLNGIDMGSHHGRPVTLRLHLRKGRNQFVALLRNSGQRGIHLRIGLQLPGQAGRVRVLLPGPPEVTDDLVRAESWMREIRMAGRDRLVSKGPPAFPVQVILGKQRKRPIDWQPAHAQFTLPSRDYTLRDELQVRERIRAFIEARKVLIIVVEMRVRDQILSRGIEIPPDYPIVLPDPTRSPEVHRLEYLTRMLERRPYNETALFDTYFVEGIIRRKRGEPPVHDEFRLEAALQRVDQRMDCADFDLAFALRFCRLGAGTDEDRRRIRESALKFRYWKDDPGADVMVFHGENHPLLFHSDELIAGNIWPDDVFTNTGKKGREHATLGLQRSLAYLDKLESEGYEEFLSTTYTPVTTGALMNLVDFSDDPDISRRAARQVDKIYRMLAEHSFDGVMMGPQGRTSRRMLYPQVSPAQSLISYATPRAVEAFDSWVIFVASSPSYRPPAGLDELMASPIRKQYRETYCLINLNKTSEYMLSSVEISASAKDPSFTQQLVAGGRGYQWYRSLVPGGPGYQQHAWHAALARDCHVFTTHPGSSSDRGDGTPGFWTGNSTFARQTQNGHTLLQIFSIPEDHPIQFTHAHWPSKVFDAEKIRGHWAFGRKNKGYIALWCSTKPILRSEVVINRELRAWGNKMAWVCICSGESESGDFDAFIRSCERLAPKFDPKALTLRLKGQDKLNWHDGGKGTSK